MTYLYGFWTFFDTTACADMEIIQILHFIQNFSARAEISARQVHFFESYFLQNWRTLNNFFEISGNRQTKIFQKLQNLYKKYFKFSFFNICTRARQNYDRSSFEVKPIFLWGEYTEQTFTWVHAHIWQVRAKFTGMVN